MEFKGINYDTGTKTTAGGNTREYFDQDVVATEIGIIKNVLHCNAIRISGFDVNRIITASVIALDEGLTVWFSASLQYDNPKNTLDHMIRSAQAAELLRARNPSIVLVIGCELTLFTSGFVVGSNGEERMKNVFSPLSLLKNGLGMSRRYNTRLNRFLADAVLRIRNEFHGQITYASGAWEKVDWKIFDIFGVDYYRSAYNRSIYISELQKFKQLGKRVVVMEFGCCAYQGAEDKGAMGWNIIDWKKSPAEIKGGHLRDEQVQAGNILDLLKIFELQGVFGAFVFTFATYNYLANDDPRFDLDLGSYGIVKMIPKERLGYEGLPWIPKKAFFALGNYYAES